ncbi:MAG: hypothetical protein RIS41_820 [Actinomycetota bacterium]
MISVLSRRRSTTAFTRKATPPRAITTARYDTHRTITNTVSTPVAPERLARTPPINSPTSTSPVSADPTVNVKAPRTRCPSPDTTRQATTWMPSSSVGKPVSSKVVGDSPTTTEPPPTGSPSASKIWIESADGDTTSEKSRRMTSGESSRTADGAGSDESNDAWAEAGPAEPTSATNDAADTATTTPMRRRRRVVERFTRSDPPERRHRCRDGRATTPTARAAVGWRPETGDRSAPSIRALSTAS